VLRHTGKAGNLAVFLNRRPASLSAFLTMLGVMLFALASAGFTDLDTGVHNLGDEAGPATHVSSRGPAHISTVNAKVGALGHAAQALVSTVFTFIGAVNRNIDTRLSYFVSHENSPLLA